WASHMGLIDLLIERDGNHWKVVDPTSEARPIYTRDADREVVPSVDNLAAVEEAVKADHEATLAYIRAPVGKTSAPLYSYFALVADDSSVQIVSQAPIWYNKDLIKDSQSTVLPLRSAASPFKPGGRGAPEYYTDVP